VYRKVTEVSFIAALGRESQLVHHSFMNGFNAFRRNASLSWMEDRYTSTGTWNKIKLHLTMSKIPLTLIKDRIF
jgi:hypothetical protein